MIHFTLIPGIKNRKAFEKRIQFRQGITDQMQKANNICDKILSLRRVSIFDIKGRKRERYISDTRKLISFFVHKNTELSLVRIGDIINKDHATVLYHVRNCSDLILTDKEHKNTVMNIGHDLDLRW